MLGITEEDIEEFWQRIENDSNPSCNEMGIEEELGRKTGVVANSRSKRKFEPTQTRRDGM